MSKYIFGVTVFVAVVGVLYVGSVKELNSVAPSAVNGVPLELTSEKFDEAVADPNKIVLVSFWAPWCEPSLVGQKTLNELALEFRESLIVGRINLDECEEVGIKCDIKRIPTLIYFQNGNEIKRLVGVRSRDQIREDFVRVAAP